MEMGLALLSVAVKMRRKDEKRSESLDLVSGTSGLVINERF